MLKGHLTLRGGKFHGIRRIGLLLARIEQRKHAARRGIRRLDLRNDVGDLVERLGVLVGIGQEDLHAAHRKRRGHARDHAHAADHSDHGIDDVIDKTRTGVGERTHKLRALARGVELGIEGIEALLSVGAIGKGVDKLLLAHILLDMTTELPLNALLNRKALVGELGNSTGSKDGKRRDEHHHERHGQVNGEHKRERANDGNNTGEELRKALQQTVAHLVDVVDHAAHKVAVGMAVDKAERHAAELIARLHAHVAHRFVGQAVDAIALQPLEGRSTYDDNRELGNERQQRIEVHLPGGDDKVDALANENGRVELQNHRDGGTQKRCRKRDAVRMDIAQQAAGHRTHGIALGIAGLARTVSQVVEAIVAGHVGRHRGDRTGGSVRIHLAALLCADGCGDGRGAWGGRGRRTPLLTLELLAAKLRLANLAVELAGRVELIVRAQARDRTVAKYADHIGVAHGRNALAYDHRSQRQPALGGTAHTALADGMAKRRVGLKVERRGRIVHDQYLRRAHQGARDGQALALATAEVLTARLDRGIEPLRLVAHELARLRHVERHPELLVGRSLVAPGQVAADGAAHQRRALWNGRDHTAQLVERPGAHVGTHHAHAAGARIVQARDKRDECGLAATRATDNAERFAHRQFQGHIAHGICRARAKRKARMAQAQRGDWSDIARLGQCDRFVVLVGDARLAIEHLIDARRAGARLGKDHDQVGDVHDGGERLRHVVHKRHDLALRKLAHVDLDAAHP